MEVEPSDGAVQQKQDEAAKRHVWTASEQRGLRGASVGVIFHCINNLSISWLFLVPLSPIGQIFALFYLKGPKNVK